MTEQQLRQQELAEKKRHSREEENLTEKGQKRGLIGQIVSSTTRGLIPGIIGKINDPSWYNLDPQAVKDAASFSFGNAIGNKEQNPIIYGDKYGDPVPSSTVTLYDPNDNAIPGVAVLNFAPTIGTPRDGYNAANIASQNIYAFIRHANSGAKNYEKSDVMQYLLSFDGLYSYVSHLSKVYSIALTAKSENRYYAEAMLNALNFVTEDFVDTLGSTQHSILNKLADFRLLINRAIVRLNSFNVPAVMPYFTRHVWMSTNIFKDAPYKRSRIFMFNPTHLFHRPDANGVMKEIPHSATYNYNGKLFQFNTQISFEQVEWVLTTLLNELFEDADVGILSGDILKAYGEDKLFRLAEIPEDFHIESTYSEEILSQIDGATVLPAEPYDLRFKQVGTTNDIIMGCRYPQVDSGGQIVYVEADEIRGSGFIFGSNSPSTETQFPSGKRVRIEMPTDNPNPDDIMVATRLATTWYFDGPVHVGSGFRQYQLIYVVSSCGSEMLTSVTFARFNFTGGTRTIEIINTGEWLNSQDIEIDTNSLSPYEIQSIYGDMQLIRSFEHAPRLYSTVMLKQSSNNYVNGIIVFYDNDDLKNYITLTEYDLSKVHAVAISSELGIGGYGRAISKPSSNTKKR